MSFRPGSMLGPYEVTALIGSGGMGDVFRARDTRLHRDVAIKTSKAGFDTRFQREAQAIAALNHPNICTLYDIGPDYLVMEYIDGLTLADRMRQGAIAVDDALAIAAQIAAALDAAHERGIIHRDLKPLNIKLRPDGSVKVLDFGLARTMETAGDDAANSPTLSLPTRAGMILGTAGYMSPEQARGQAVDKRADIWAFGVVLYEMVTGSRLFDGATTSDALAAILTKEPDLSAAPARLRRLLARCLEKDPKQRLRDIGEYSWWLSDPPASIRRSKSPWLVAGGAAVAAAGVIAWSVMRGATIAPQSQSSTRLMLTVPLSAEASRLGPQLGFRAVRGLAISPDGQTIVYVGPGEVADRFRLYVRSLDDYEVRPLQGTDGASAPFFSPDGQSVAFFAGGKLRRIPIVGGTITTICDAPDDTSGGSGGAWQRDGTIVFARPTSARAGLYRVTAQGGTPELLVAPDPAEEGGLGDPVFVAGTEWLLFTTRLTKVGVAPSIVARSMVTGQQHKLTFGGEPGQAGLPAAPSLSKPTATSTGQLVFRQANRIMAVLFQPQTAHIAGTAIPLAEAVADFDLSASGRLVYIDMPKYGGQLVWVDRRGNVEPISDPDERFGRPRLSPNGSRIALEVLRGDRTDIGLYQLDRKAMTLLTTDGANNSPLWYPDGRRVVFRAADGLASQSTEGAGGRESLLKSTEPALRSASAIAPGVFVPQDLDSYIFVVHGSAATGPDIFRIRLAGNRTLEPLVRGAGNQWAVRISPDGRWLSYASDESGRFEIYLQSMAPGGPRYVVSTNGGTEAVWAASGAELFYWERDQLMAVPIAPGQAESPVGTPKPLFTGRFQHTDLPQYDVARDGQRFVMIRPLMDDIELRTIRVVDGWVSQFASAQASR